MIANALKFLVVLMFLIAINSLTCHFDGYTYMSRGRNASHVVTVYRYTGESGDSEQTVS